MVKEKIWHARNILEIFRELETNEKGLTSAEAEKRLQKYGPNELEEEKPITKLALLAAQLRSPLIAVLVIAASISLLLGKMIDMIVVVAVIVFNTSIGFFQEYKAEAALRALKSMAAPEAEVIRDCPEEGACIEMRIKTREIVPGDIILLDSGDKIPADARILEAVNLEIDESMLTGESTPVRKVAETLAEDLPVAERINMAFAGTIVTRGRGKAVVVETGMETEMGKIAKLIKETEKAEIPIKRRITDLTKKLGLLALFASSLTLALGLLRGFEFYEVFLFALASAVSAIPEGLPAVMTITLAVGVNRMAKRNAIIRKLQAVDTLGSATVICTDKTGTLTTNQMTVKKILVNNRMVEVTGAGFTPVGQFIVEGNPVDALKDESLRQFLAAATLCTDARLRRREVKEGYRWEIAGDPTEGALVVAAEKARLHKDELEEKLPRIDEIPFDPKQRYMATFHIGESKKLKAYVKGAPETIIRMCHKILEDGKIENLVQREKEKILTISTQMASEGLRVLAIAFQEIEKDKLVNFKAGMQTHRAKLVFVGLAGITDPPRPEAKSAVQLCKRAGIKVVMITGDHKLTAEAIAKEIGIYKIGSQILTGSDIDNFSDDQLDAVVDETSVFARMSPTHKHRVVESFRRRGHIVAVTGDGVNDAPALKAAEIGIAMGVSGTDVTKETADMVLADDNFASIVNAVEEGRVMFENVRKVVKYLITTNVGEILTLLTALTLLSNAPLIFTPVQILWVNLVTDGLLDVTLALEPKEEDVMDQPPRKAEEKVINRDIMLSTIYVAAIMATGTLWVFIKEWNGGSIVRAQTLGFTTMAMFQVYNSLNCRSRNKSIFKLGLFTNKYLLGAIAASVMLQISATIFPFFQTALGTIRLSVGDWLTIATVSSLVFVGDELRKFVRSRIKKHVDWIKDG
ncbi:MAG: HAD-IC family P-type ATPase [Candidatus Bathyarchaeia archaeon]